MERVVLLVSLSLSASIALTAQSNCCEANVFQGAQRSEINQSLTSTYTSSAVAVLDSRPVVVDGVVNGLNATIKNTGSQPVIAFEVLWTLTLTDCKPTATASRDMIFADSPIPPGGTLNLTSYVGGWPVSALKGVSAQVSYYQLANKSEYDSQLTKIASDFKQRRTKALELFRLIQIAGRDADPEKAITSVLSNRDLDKDPTAAIPLLELRGLHKQEGRVSLLQFVERNLAAGAR
jgi:hypothetical protein